MHYEHSHGYAEVVEVLNALDVFSSQPTVSRRNLSVSSCAWKRHDSFVNLPRYSAQQSLVAQTRCVVDV
jgi:hypothetical protein